MRLCLALVAVVVAGSTGCGSSATGRHSERTLNDRSPWTVPEITRVFHERRIDLVDPPLKPPTHTWRYLVARDGSALTIVVFPTIAAAIRTPLIPSQVVMNGHRLPAPHLRRVRNLVASWDDLDPQIDEALAVLR